MFLPCASADCDYSFRVEPWRAYLGWFICPLCGVRQRYQAEELQDPTNGEILDHHYMKETMT